MSMDYTSIDMRRRMQACLSHMKLILIHNKSSPSFSIDNAHEITHQYSDKYLLAEYLVNTSIAQVLNDAMLWTSFKEHLPTILSWSHDSSVSFRFHSKQDCVFVKEIDREVEDVTKHESEWKGSIVGSMYSGKTTSKVIKTIKEFVYRFTASYQLTAFSGVGEDPSQFLVIESYQAEQEIIATSKSFPYPEHKNYKFDVNMSWLFRCLSFITAQDGGSESGPMYQPQFRIDRSRSDCWTPSQNGDTKASRQFYTNLLAWTNQITSHLMHDLFPVQRHEKNAKADLDSIRIDGLFQPVLPLLCRGPSTTAASSHNSPVDAALVHYSSPSGEGSSGASLPPSLVNRMLAEQHRALSAKCDELKTLYPGNESAIISAKAAKLLLVMRDLAEVVANVNGGISFIEQMIRSQLVAAIGKEVTAAAFAQYMDFHNRKLFKSHYQPKPFSFAVRRSVHHSPEGLIRIDSPGVPINTICSCSVPAHEVASSDIEQTYIHVALNASTTIRFGGDRYIHGWLGHRFSNEPLPALTLVAQARQFCSFIVLIGRMVSVREFEPKHGFIAHSKDDFAIPLDLEPIPTAKEFKDAITSLSPEQQRFAKAFRSMQLESTLFAVCVIQIKPQLEAVLNLPSDSLTKEIKLTQDLIQLFTKYQISSDLLSYDESVDRQSSSVGVSAMGSNKDMTLQETDSCKGRLLAVKAHVRAIYDMLDDTKKEQLKEKRLEAKYNASDKLVAIPRESDDEYIERSDSIDSAYMSSDRIFTLDDLSLGNGHSEIFHGFDNDSVVDGYQDKSLPRSVKPSSTVIPASRLQKKSASLECMVSTTAMPPMGGTASMVDNSRSTTAPSVRATAPRDKATVPVADDDPTDFQPSSAHGPMIDYTKYPSKLDASYEQLDPDSKFRATIINVGKTWTKASQASLLSGPNTTTLQLSEAQQISEKSAAFDLLDALTRAGALPIEQASLHVIIAGTQCFDQSLMDAVVCRNINPIDRVERSTLIMAATLHDESARDLIHSDQLQRVTTLSPMLFIEE